MCRPAALGALQSVQASCAWRTSKCTGQLCLAHFKVCRPAALGALQSMQASCACCFTSAPWVRQGVAQVFWVPCMVRGRCATHGCNARCSRVRQQCAGHTARCAHAHAFPRVRTVPLTADSFSQPDTCVYGVRLRARRCAQLIALGS